MHTFFSFFIQFFCFIVRFLPPRLRYYFVRRLADISAFFIPGLKKGLRTNLAHLLYLEGKELEHMTDEALRNFATTLHDFFFPQSLNVEVQEKNMLEALRKKHGGILLLTFHMGHWELGARVMRSWGWPVTAVYQPYKNKRLKKIIESQRAPGVNFIPVGQGAAAGVRQSLRRGDVVAMLGDHNFGEDGIPVDILGHKIIWPKGPVLLAVKSKAPIVVAVVIRTAPHTYKAVVSEPLIPKGASRKEVAHLVQEVGHKFGMLLKQYPTQWYRLSKLQFNDN